MFKDKPIMTAGLLLAVCLITLPLAAELRDPTRPSGFHGAQDPASGMLTSDELKLQAIFYNPKHPSALINGRRYVMGDPVGDAEIKAIYSDRVVLITAAGESELTMIMPSVKTRPAATLNGPARGNK